MTLVSMGLNPSASAGESERRLKSRLVGLAKSGSAMMEPTSWPVFCQSAKVSFLAVNVTGRPE